MSTVYELGEIEDRFPEDLLIGVDEVGVGSWAGPMVAAAVILDPFLDPAGINDSKKLTEIRRSQMAKKIREEALFLAVSVVRSKEVDKLGIKKASEKVKRRALQTLLEDYAISGGTMKPLIIVDGEFLVPGIRKTPQRAFIKGDQRSWNVAAASIVAKDHRDDWMRNVAAARWPGYGFRSHKGYGTRMHGEKLKELGVCPIHRRIMKPVKRVLGEENKPKSIPRRRMDRRGGD